MSGTYRRWDPHTCEFFRHIILNLCKHQSLSLQQFSSAEGRVIRHLTEPELALQAAQEFTGQIIPPKWCKIGRSVAKAAAARIPGNFVFASVYDGKGDEYNSQDMDSAGITAQVGPKSRLSTPLSEPPIKVLRTDQGTHHGAKLAPMEGWKDFLAAPLRRKFNSSLGPGVTSEIVGPDCRCVAARGTRGR